VAKTAKDTQHPSTAHRQFTSLSCPTKYLGRLAGLSVGETWGTLGMSGGGDGGSRWGKDRG
jgi:hypothetical protein